MDLFQGSDATFWLVMSIILTVMVSVASWYFTIVGADRKPRPQQRGEDTIERYGDIEEDRAPIPPFLIWTYVGIAVWAVAYAVWTGVYGVGL